MVEHLSKPIDECGGQSRPSFDINQSFSEVISNKNIHNQDSEQAFKKNKSSTLEAKWMYELIYAYVIPKWIKYLQLKSERSIDTQAKPRPDTLWKKILRDVREFFRILFRLRFHHLEFKDVEGAALWVQTLFDELGIPLADNEANDYKLFRFVHQTHKAKNNAIDELSTSPYEAIEKFNEVYKKAFMTNFTCARMLYFVFQNFLDVYSVQVKSRYRKDVVTMIVMVLNCFKRMTSYHHIKRIWFLLN